jgi:hypothetical protein
MSTNINKMSKISRFMQQLCNISIVMLKYCWAISHVNAELKSNLSWISSTSTIRVRLIDPDDGGEKTYKSLVFNSSFTWLTIQEDCSISSP